MPVKYKIFFSLIISISLLKVDAQINITSKSPSADSVKIIQIIQAASLRQITINDSTIFETLSGKAIVKQGNTTLSGDSIILNKRLGTVEVFGNVHINDADTVNTFAQYLKYLGKEQIAYLYNKVKFSDGKALLFTDQLEYNIKTGIAQYKNGGKVINEKTTLTSKNAVYYSDTKDAIFQHQVHLTDPKYDMTADSLRYNTAFKNAYFISPTHIKSKNGTIDTKSGTYNLQTGEALFFEKTIFRDQTKFISGNKIAIDEKNNIIQIEDNGKFIDSLNKIIVIGNQILIDNKKNTFLATRKPVMIFYRDNDSTYIAADTLFSGKKFLPKNNAVNDTMKKQIENNKSISVDSIQYFLGFHHVRIFNDSIQAVCDSLHYSTEDSTFKLFQHPICWNGSTQISGDTMYLLTENQKAKKIKIYFNSIVVNKTKEGLFNQNSGKTMNVFFKDEKIDYIITKGNPTESIFYTQDDDSAYIGMNKCSGDEQYILFEAGKVAKIKYSNEVNGTLYPFNQIPISIKFLKNFSWQDDKRPKNKLEIFE